MLLSSQQCMYLHKECAQFGVHCVYSNTEHRVVGVRRMRHQAGRQKKSIIGWIRAGLKINSHTVHAAEFQIKGKENT